MISRLNLFVLLHHLIRRLNLLLALPQLLQRIKQKKTLRFESPQRIHRLRSIAFDGPFSFESHSRPICVSRPCILSFPFKKLDRIWTDSRPKEGPLALNGLILQVSQPFFLAHPPNLHLPDERVEARIARLVAPPDHTSLGKGEIGPEFGVLILRVLHLALYF